MNTTANPAIRTSSAPTRNPPSEVEHCPGCGAPAIAEPQLVCAHCGGVIRLRCFVYRRGQEYRAECIDLDIATEGSTPEEAIAGLQDAMQGYLSVVFEGGDRKGLLLRKSPLLHRLHYHLASIRDRFLAIFSDHRRTCTAEKYYSVPSHTHC